jgi:hypothetical protein
MIALDLCTAASGWSQLQRQTFKLHEAHTHAAPYMINIGTGAVQKGPLGPTERTCCRGYRQNVTVRIHDSNFPSSRKAPHDVCPALPTLVGALAVGSTATRRALVVAGCIAPLVELLGSAPMPRCKRRARWATSATTTLHSASSWLLAWPYHCLPR